MPNYTSYSLGFTSDEFDNATSLYKNSIADLFSVTEDYFVNDFVIYNGTLYQCISDISYGEWDEDSWQEVVMFSNKPGDEDILYSSGSPFIALPTVAETYYYTGSQITPVFLNYSSATLTMTGTTYATVPGTYTVTFDINDKNRYTWSDGTTEPKNVAWTIERAIVPLPVIGETSFEYDGTAKTVSVTYDTERVTLAGTTSATNAGQYVFNLSLNNIQYSQWSNGTTNPITCDWEIRRAAEIDLPELDTYIIMYDGNSHTVTPTYDSEKVSVSGTLTATNIGVYTVTFTITNTNYKWGDDTTEPKELIWEITDVVVLDRMWIHNQFGDAYQLDVVNR